VLAVRSIVLGDDLLDELDDAAAEPGIFDEGERLGQGQTVGRGEEFGDVIRRVYLLRPSSAWLERVLKKEGTRHLQGVGYLLDVNRRPTLTPLILLRRLGPRLEPVMPHLLLSDGILAAHVIALPNRVPDELSRRPLDVIDRMQVGRAPGRPASAPLARSGRGKAERPSRRSRRLE
jgi:hypothetical protein